MKIVVNPLGRQINEYLMRMALPLGLLFIVEYLISCAALHHMMLGLLVWPLKLCVPVALWWVIRRIRQIYLCNAIPGFTAWTFGTQLMFFAGLLEAMFIYVYNEFLRPGNLAAVQQGMIEQYQNVYNELQQLGMYKESLPTLQQMIDKMKEAPVSSAIETAISTLSSDIFVGMLLMIPIALIVRRKPNL